MKIKAEFVKDNVEVTENFKLPKRSTTGSAGYDFFAENEIVINPGEYVLYDSKIKVKIPDGWYLGIFPRSGLGFKYGVRLANTVGIIDSDYYSDEIGKGVIKFKLFNPSETPVVIEAGKAFAQGIFMQYGICDNDVTIGERNGEGFGSTDSK